MSQDPTADPKAVPVVLVPQRHPLKLPEGSVRVSLVLLILLPFWLLLALPAPAVPELPHMPLFLYLLLGLVVVFFAWHDRTVTPWHLPWWFFPVAIILVSAALVGWQFYNDWQYGTTQSLERLIPPEQQMRRLPFLVLSLGSGFLLGWVVRHLGDWVHTPAFQDIRASVSLLAMLLLSAAIIIHLFINPQLVQAVESPVLEYIVTFLIAWYFGTRA
jgi:hypothetical protein